MSHHKTVQSHTLLPTYYTIHYTVLVSGWKAGTLIAKDDEILSISGHHLVLRCPKTSSITTSC